MQENKATPIVEKPYPSNSDYLKDHLNRIRLHLSRYMVLHAERFLCADGQMNKRPGICVGVEEMRRALSGTLEISPEIAEYNRAIDDLNRKMAAKVKVTLKEGGRLPLESLRTRYNLSQTAVDILVALIAPEIDPAIGRAYTHAWVDFTKKQAEVGFVMELLSNSPEEAETIRDLLSPNSALLKYSFVHVVDGGSHLPQSPLVNCRVKIAGRVTDYLMGKDLPDSQYLAPGVRIVQSRRTKKSVIMDPTVWDVHKRALALAQKSKNPARLLMVGEDGVGKKSLVESSLSPKGLPMLVADMGRLPDDHEQLTRAVENLLREACLQDGVVYLDHLEALDNGQTDWGKIRSLFCALDNHPLPIYMASSLPLSWGKEIPEAYVVVTVPKPDENRQLELWKRYLPSSLPISKAVKIPELVHRFNVTGGIIETSSNQAEVMARLEGGGDTAQLELHHLESSLSRQMSNRLASIAEQVPLSLKWNDLVVPDDVSERLLEIAAFARHRKIVYETWGFGSKFPYGRGLSALFSGPPGTGKTMAASIIAGELNMQLYRIDLSRIVDRYVGETEKNLKRVFDAASDGHGVILFDEADSLFAKRTDVKSSIDRYANLEVNFLLQQMESFEGVTVLTTNFAATIDEAFKRRLRFRINFPFPDKDHRLLIWKSMLPPEAIYSDDLDLESIAEDYEMSGGLIKNALLRAAFIAADRNQPIDTTLLAESAEIEYSEMGRLSRR